MLTRDMNIQEAAQVFEAIEGEALAVVESATDRRVVGLLSEAQVLRRTTEELDRACHDLSIEAWIGEH